MTPLVIRVAFCGLGRMGSAMAGRLVRAGFDVTVWNRNPARCVPLVNAGARSAASPAEAAAGCEVAIVMVADGPAVRAVLTGGAGLDGLAAAAPPTVVQMSTIAPDEVTALPALLPATCALLDAPVLGSVPQADEGRLRILVGGGDAVVTAVGPVLAALGEPVRTGPVGSASALKLVLNAAVAPMVALLAEALALADGLGLDRSLVLDELAGSRLGPLVARKRHMIESGRYEPDSVLALHAKDLRLVLDAAERLGIPAHLAAAAARHAQDAVLAGLGDRDYAVVVEHLRVSGDTSG